MLTRGVQTVITGGYCILPTASANRLGGGSYLYNRWLAVIDYITGGYITAFEDGFWAGFVHFLGCFSADFKIKIQNFMISNKSKSKSKSKSKYKYKFKSKTYARSSNHRQCYPQESH
jgi:hypothetical protein